MKRVQVISNPKFLLPSKLCFELIAADIHLINQVIKDMHLG